jgi:hypothetical protein
MNLEDLAAIRPARLPFPVTRAWAPPVECRSAEDPAAMPTMVGHFSTFGDWYEVDSWIEGHFLESIKAGAFRKTIRESRDQMKVLYDHGQDPQIGNKVLGSIEALKEDATGPAYEVPLFDTSYNRDLRPGLEAGVYGSSFRFSVEKDAWDHEPDASDYNPKGIPERTITEARVFEFGPVTFPANPNATAGVRSTTDSFYQRSRDPEAFETLLRSAQAARTPADAGAAASPVEPPADTQEPPEPSRSDTPPAVVEPPVVAVIPEPKENRTVEYITREEKVSRIADIKDELSRIAVEFPGVLPAAEQAQWDALEKEQPELERDVAAWDYRQARIRANAENEKTREVVGPAPFTVIRTKTDAEISDIGEIRSQSRTEEEFRQGLRDNAMRVVERTRYPHPKADQDGAKAHVASLLDHSDSPDGELAKRVIMTNHPAYKRAFGKVIAGKPLSSEEARAAGALAVGVVGTGGYAVPHDLDPTIIGVGAHTSVNPYRAACRVVSLVGTNIWQALTSEAVAAAYTTEAAAETERGPAFLQPEYKVLRASTFISLSIEMLQDRPDIGSELAVLIQEGKDTLEENKFSVGAAGGAVPFGMFVTGQYTEIETIANNLTAKEDLFAIEAGVPIRHRANAAWLMSRTAIRTFQGYETSGGVLFNRPFATVGNPALNATGNTGLQLLGYPVWEAPSAPATMITNAAEVAWLGDPKSYIIVDRVGMDIEVIPHLFGAAQGNLPTGQRGLFAMWRNMAKAVNNDAGRLLKINAP